ncbi:hypothetical protein D9M69_466210 [compost metagenome]
MVQTPQRSGVRFALSRFTGLSVVARWAICLAFGAWPSACSRGPRSASCGLYPIRSCLGTVCCPAAGICQFLRRGYRVPPFSLERRVAGGGGTHATAFCEVVRGTHGGDVDRCVGADAGVFELDSSQELRIGGTFWCRTLCASARPRLGFVRQQLCAGSPWPAANHVLLRSFP